MTDNRIMDNISAVYKRISHAARRAGRKPEDIKLIAVTKTVSPEQIKKAMDAGLRIFGESKVQEAQKKISNLIPNKSGEISRLGRVAEETNLQIEWHLIGHLQKNKAKTAVELFNMIHSVDSLELAEVINKHAEKAGKTQKILLQVKLSTEESKYGILKDNIFRKLGDISKLKNLSIVGLMTIPPFFENAENARPYFSELRTLRDKAKTLGFNIPELSMGMTNDYEVAIEEGATMVRIGSAIFGERKYCRRNM